MAALTALAEACAETARSVTSAFGTIPSLPSSDRLISVIKPGSKGWCTLRDNQVFLVDGVFVHPTTGLSYRGKYENTPDGDT